MNVTQNVPDGFLTTIILPLCAVAEGPDRTIWGGCPGKGPRTGAEESSLSEQVHASGLTQVQPCPGSCR